MIDETDQGAIEKMTGQNGGQKRRDQAGAAIERHRGEGPDRGDRQDADDRRHQRGDALDVLRSARCGPA